MTDLLADVHLHAMAPAAELAFYLVFGVFVVAFVVLVVITMRWAVRRDRAGRAEWARRQAEASGPGVAEGAPEAGGPPRRPPSRRGGPRRG